jgi:hypothetical protein
MILWEVNNRLFTDPAEISVSLPKEAYDYLSVLSCYVSSHKSLYIYYITFGYICQEFSADIYIKGVSGDP